MPDVNVTVNIDGKTVFVHGAAAAVDPNLTAITALSAGLSHFQALKAASTPPLAGYGDISALKAEIAKAQNHERSHL